VSMKVGIACGGTGGHIYPGLAVAKELSARGHDVSLWLAGRDAEKGAAGEWKGKKEDGYPSWISHRFPFVLLGAALGAAHCKKRMKADRPDVVLGMGSYASVAPVLAASKLGIPVILHEANVVPGRATSLLCRYASVVALSFPESGDYLAGIRTEVTGFPGRYKADPQKCGQRSPGAVFTILITGGSQGAQRLNDVTIKAASILQSKGVNMRVLHVAGRANEEDVKVAYKDAGASAEVFGYVNEMDKLYMLADLAVARSGAATCSELAAFGLPALLVPLPSAKRNHQLANAMVLKSSGGADVTEQDDFTPEGLAEYIEACMSDPAMLEKMRDALKGFAVKEGVRELANLVEELSQASE
jgi:UDP-N-acetylglucosamine--N-acetylmuramyl-(pentapeptide) pyrophosphoryl-undecaprenol N-acetylglucosamine transferase